MLAAAYATRPDRFVAGPPRAAELAAIAAGFTARSIVANLATAVTAAAEIGNWPDIVRFVELARAARQTYEFERLDSTIARVEFERSISLWLSSARVCS